MSRIHARIPKPNNNITMTVGNKVLVESVFSDTGLVDFLDDLKRKQGNSVAVETIALVANSVEMTGLSVRRLDRILEDERVRAEYGLGANAPRSIYRTVERLGENSDAIVGFLGKTLKTRYGVGMDTVFLDWTSMYFEAPPNWFVKRGYSRDHRPDRPQVTVGLSMDRSTGMPVGLTIKPGNILDVTHFKDTFDQIQPLLPKDAMIVFDNGAYSKDNSDAIDKKGFGFITHLQLNQSDDNYVRGHPDGWISIDHDISYMKLKGNKGRTRFIFRSESRRMEIIDGYRRRAKHDWQQMGEMKEALEKGKKPRKKYRISNCFVDTRLSYVFPLNFSSEEEAIEHAVKHMISGREGLFVLLTNRSLSAEKVLNIYRSRNAVETAFRDLKHGIDWRPARCTSENAIKGRILISFLALFCMSMFRFLHKEYRNVTADYIIEQLSSFSLTIIEGKDGVQRRIFSNFTPLIRALANRKRAVPVPKAPEQTSLDGY